MMIVTVTTDASYCPNNSIGGYAFWISSEIGKVQYSGKFSGYLVDPNEAELKAIGNAIYFLLQADQFKRVEKVIINTDSQTCIRLLTDPKYDNYLDTQNMIKGMLKKRRIDFEMRHVKAHTNGSTSRRYVNNWCDRMAQMEMRAKRKAHCAATGLNLEE